MKDVEVEEFLNVFESVAAAGDWEFSSYAGRNDAIRERNGGCPLSFVCGSDLPNVPNAAKSLGIIQRAADLTANAADFSRRSEPEELAVRHRLLAACGLSL